MLQFVLAGLLATSTLAAPPASIKWPNIFEPCAIRNPEFKDCAKRNLQKAIVSFSAGVPELDVPSFDPLVIPEVLLDYKRDNSEGKMIIRNSKSFGLKNAEVLDFRAKLSDPSDLTIDVDFRLPAVFVEGEYKAEGNIVGFPISGKGVYNISMREVTGTWEVKGDMVTIGGQQHMKVRHVDLFPEVGDMKVYASNLFTGSNELDKAALRFVNLYWPVLYKELLPFAAEGWDQFLRGILNKFFLKVPFSVIFPEA